MSDTPTPADDRLVAVFQDAARILYRAEAEAVVAALRNSPDALADLNGGEWVQIVDPDPPFTLWVDSEGGTWWTKDDDPPHPDWTHAYHFVPREATDGSN